MSGCDRCSLYDSYPKLSTTKGTDMKYLLSSMAIIAAVTIAAPAWAQRTGPGPGAWTGSGPGVVPPGGFGPSSPNYNVSGSSPYYGSPYSYGWPYYYGSSYYYRAPYYYGSTYSPYYYGSPYYASPSSYYYGQAVR
jgi:hypothetical protein